MLLAPGHPGLSLPSELGDDTRVVHAYEPHAYASRVAIVGAGMAAATEWLNALDAGAEVVSVRRREPLRRPLNLPRPLFSKRGLRRFHATPPAERAALLAELSAPSYPPGRAWDEPLERAAEEGRFRVAASVNGEEQVICATGFQRGYVHDPLLRRLRPSTALETQRQLARARPRLDRPRADRRDADARCRRRPGAVGLPGVRHARRDEVRRPPIPPQGEGMSYTLRGRLESRLAASILPFLAACALSLGLGAWWPLELAGAMIGAGLALDVGLYHRLLPYQPAWAALPLGLLELTATMALVRLFDVAAPLEPALWFFFGSWVLAQVLGARRLAARAAHLRRGRGRARPRRPRALRARPRRPRGGPRHGLVRRSRRPSASPRACTRARS